MSFNTWKALCTLAFFLSAPLWVQWNFFMPERPSGLAIAFIPGMILFILGAIRSIEKNRPWLQGLLISSLLLKIVAVAAYSWMTFGYYGYADNGLYFDSAVAADTLAGAVKPGAATTGTPFLMRTTWVVVQLLGDSFSSVAFFFAALAFVGQWIFVRILLHEHQSLETSLAIPLTLFMPSLLFWSASVGKEALIFFGISLFCFGFSKIISSGFGVAPVLIGSGGILLTMMIRPHIALMLAVAAFSGITMTSDQASRVGFKRPIRLGVGGRLAGFVLLGAAIVYFVPRAQSFLQLDELSIESTSSYLTMRIGQTDIGGSAIGTASFAARAIGAPFLLFRPMPWEISSPTAAVSSLEGLLLMLIAWKRRHQLRLTLGDARRNPYILFQILLLLEFVVAFSSISNLGIVARQRIMVMPMFFWLLSYKGHRLSRPTRRRVRRTHNRLRTHQRPLPGLTTSRRLDGISAKPPTESEKPRGHRCTTNPLNR